MSSELRVDKIVPIDGAPANGGGGIIQIIHDTSSTESSTSSGNYVTTGLSLNITPKFSTSKILVCWEFRGNADSSYNRMEFFIYRQINSGSNANLTSGASGNSAGQAAGQWPVSGGSDMQAQGEGGIDYLDDPSFSSGDKITYKIYVRDGNNDGSSFSINRGRANLSNQEETAGASSVTAFEISSTS